MTSETDDYAMYQHEKFYRRRTSPTDIDLSLFMQAEANNPPQQTFKVQTREERHSAKYKNLIESISEDIEYTDRQITNVTQTSRKTEIVVCTMIILYGLFIITSHLQTLFSSGGSHH
jgi:hypothetical protein